MRFVAMFVGVLLVLAAQPALACGAWSMTDLEKKRDIRYLLSSAVITSGKKRLGAVYLDIDSKQAKRDGMRAVRDRKVQFDIKDGKLRKYGKPVATIDGNTITFGKRPYTIELTDPHKLHDALPAWKLVVRRGNQVIIESPDASSLCSGLNGRMTPEQQEDEVRRRVIYYLAWREVGG